MLRQKSSAIESLLVSYGVTFTFFALYVLLNAFLFGFAAKEEYKRHEDFQKITTTIARGCGATLNLNFAMVLLIASRSFVSFLRDTPLSFVVSLDSLMPGLHGIIGTLVLSFGAVHTFTHWATYAVKNPWTGGLGGTTYLFVTGLLLIVAIALIHVSAWDSVRRKHHEVFRRFHLGGSFSAYILLCMHGLHRGEPSSWKWVAFPLVIYAADLCHRRRQEKRSYLLISKHSALFQGQSVLRLRLPQVFHYQPGQYAEIKVPHISRTQWHPFTIASAPHEAEMVFYVKAAGNWTTQLFQLFAERFRDESSVDVEVYVRGPFGAPAQHVSQFEHLILIGGGVGATPFCSIVKSLDNYMTRWRRKLPDKGSDRKMVSPNHPLPGPDKTERATSQRRPFNDSSSSSSLSQSIRNIDELFSNTGFDFNGPLSLKSGELNPPISQKSTLPKQRAFGFDKALTKVDSAAELKPPTQRASIRSDMHAASICDDVDALRGRAAKRIVDESCGWHSIAGPGSHASKSSYWQAVNSLHGDLSVNYTCKESFDILVGMSYGTPALIGQLQKQRREQRLLDSDSLAPALAIENDDIDLTIFQDKVFLLLVYMKSVTANLLLLWVLLCRGILAGAAKLFGAVSLRSNGFAIYSSPILLSIDSALVTVVALGVAIPAIIEAYKLGPTSFACWFDLFIMTPCTVFCVIANVLAYAEVAASLQYAGVLVLFVVWPLTALLFVLRLIHVVGERVTLGDRKLSPSLDGTRTVDFIWTTPTIEDDSWLVEELSSESRPKETTLHRYITRQTKEEDGESLIDSGCEGIEHTEYGRPQWDQIMNDIAERSKNGSRVGVFLCGPESMANQVQEAVQGAMRNSIIRGLQGSSHVIRSLEEVFGSEVAINAHTGDTLEKGEPDQQVGCNVRMVFHKERFS